MKHTKKRLQYAQDAQVTDTPWKWWEWKGSVDWKPFEGQEPQWFSSIKYRRKPQWEIDGKFKIGDRVFSTLHDDLTVTGFLKRPKGYWVQTVLPNDFELNYAPEYLSFKKAEPKFKIGDRVTFADVPAVRVRHAALIGRIFTVRGFATAKETELRVLLKDEICNHGDKGVRQSLLTLAPKFKVGDRVAPNSLSDSPRYIVTDVSGGDGKTVIAKRESSGIYYRVPVETFVLAPQRLEALSKAVGFDVPMPLQEAPERGTRVFIAFTPQSSSLLWHGARSDVDELKANRLHLTAENAEIHAKALAAISSPHFCP